MSALRKISIISFCLMILHLVLTQMSVMADEPGSKTDTGRNSINNMTDQYLKEHPEVKWLRDCDKRDKDNNPIPGHVNPALVVGAGPLGTLYPPTPAAAMQFDTESKLMEGMYYSGLNQLHGFNGQVNSDLKSYTQELQAGDFMARTLQYPPNVAQQAKAQAVGQSQAMSNAMGDIAKSQSASAISYCSSFLQNFTADEGNRWNRIRNGLFMPIAVLLLLPGAVLTQVKAMATQGNPVLADSNNETNPLEGILRAVIAIFLIPATYLVVNYGIDFSNCITESIATTYKRIMKTNMYQDALGAEIRAFPVRTPRENQNAGTPYDWAEFKVTDLKSWEQNYVRNKEEDPVAKLYKVPKNKTDDAMPAAAVAARQLSFGANAALTAAWNVLCAFQMAYLSYLFFVGPIAAALWVWPMKHFRSALPNWIEGVITLCFWSLFWNTAILLMACFRGVDESSTMITSALNFLATSSVKFAFDFAGLVKAAGQEAAKKATDKAGAAGKSGGAGNDGKNHSTDSKGKSATSTGTTTETGAISTNSTSTSDNSVTNNNDMTNLTSLKAPDCGDSNTTDLMTSAPPFAKSTLIDSDIFQSQNIQLGNFTLVRSTDEQGLQHDYIATKNGIIVAELSSKNGETTSSSDGTVFTCRNDANGSHYSYTDPSGHSYSAHLASAEARSTNAIAGGTLNVDHDATKDSIALRTSEGTILLENGGTNVLVPNAARQGYDSYQLNQDSHDGTFALLDGQKLSIGTNEDGSRQISIESDKGVEAFTVKSDGDAGYSIAHTLNGDAAGYGTVTTNGASTSYANFDSANNLTDVENISGNKISSTLYDPNTKSVLGFIDSTYDTNGNSTTSYFNPDKSLAGTSTNEIKPDGGYTDTVRDNYGSIVSTQEKTPDTSGGYTVDSTKYFDGQIISSETQRFDAYSNLIPNQVASAPTATVEYANSNAINNAVSNVISSANSSSVVVDNGANQVNCATVEATTSQSVSSVVVESSTARSLETISSNVNAIDYTAVNDTRTSTYSTPSNEVSYTVPTNAVAYTSPINEVSYTSPTNGVAYTSPINEVSYTAPTNGVSYTSQQETQAFGELIRTVNAVQNPQIVQPEQVSISTVAPVPNSVPATQEVQYQQVSQAVQHQQVEQASQHQQVSQAVQYQQVEQAIRYATPIVAMASSYQTLGTGSRQPQFVEQHAPNTTAARQAKVQSAPNRNRNQMLAYSASSPVPMSSAQSKQAQADDSQIFAPPPNLCRESTDSSDVASIESTQESLQQQLANTSNNLQRSRTISDILQFGSKTNDTNEALANTHVNYTLLCTMLQKGLTYQAVQLVNVVERDIQTLSKNAEAASLIHSYIELLNKHNLVEQANSYSAHLSAANNANAINATQNLW